MGIYEDHIHQIPPMDILYHYTSLPGFLGIMDSKAMRATHSHYLNDAQEIRDGLHLIADEAGKRSQRKSGWEPKILGELAKTLMEGYFPTAVASFTQDGDLLSQWRGYAGDGGVSLGFSTEHLRSLGNGQFLLRKCIYDDEMKREMIREMLEYELTIPINGLVSEEDEANSRYTMLIARSRSLASSFKDAAFQEEAEWRLVASMVGNPAFSVRHTSTMLIPFLQQSLVLPGAAERPDIGLRDIVIGPNRHQSLLSQGAWYATQHIAQSFEVHLSRIPYRQL